MRFTIHEIWSEHPRIGGKDTRSPMANFSAHGTPPHRRGGPHPGWPPADPGRNTRASAGRTLAKGTSGYIVIGAPPRRRGGPVETGRPHGERRNTPASARRTTRARRGPLPPPSTPASTGRTPPRQRPPSDRTEHPRIGGEDAAWMWARDTTGGTTPHRRGGRLRRGHHRAVDRNTPASAGNERRQPRQAVRITPASGGCLYVLRQASRGVPGS